METIKIKSNKEKYSEFLFNLFWSAPTALIVYFISSIFVKDQNVSITIGICVFFIDLKIETIKDDLTKSKKEINSLKEEIENLRSIKQ